MEATYRRLSHLRKKIIKISQKEMSLLIEVSQGNYSEIESGKRGISPEQLAIIATTYSVNLNWLLTGEGEMFLSEGAQEAPSPPADAEQAVPCNIEVLLKVVLAVEKICYSDNLTLIPEQKVTAIAFVYENWMKVREQTGEGLQDEQIATLLKMIAA